MKRPNFFIVGAPKCGTTSLAAWLSEHPGVYMSPVKEPRYFDVDLCTGRRRSLARYEELFSGARREHVAVGEATSTYLYSEVAIPKVLEYAADARFIVMLRNPVRMAYSLHGDKLFWGDEHVADFEHAWELQPLRARGDAVTALCRDPQLLLYGPFCRLGEQLERLYGWVSPDRVCALLLENVRESPRREYLRVLDFLGLSDDGRRDFPVHNRAKERRSRSVHTVVRVLGGIRSRFGPGYRGFGVLNSISRWNSRRREREPLSPEMEATLKDYFAPDVKKLSLVLRRNLTHWIDS